VAYAGRVFERFTERARQVVVLAQDEARALGHDYIGTENILLGLLREEEGLAARTLEALGVTVERARSGVVLAVGQGEQIPTGQIPFTLRAKEALEASLGEALRMGHGHIGTEHVLLGLVTQDDDVAVRILGELGVGSETVRGELLATLAGRPRERPATASAPLLSHPYTTQRRALQVAAAAAAAALFLGVLIGRLIWG
jgi:ATP-dependent Clp protease ATP-binding subunit ClpC